MRVLSLSCSLFMFMAVPIAAAPPVLNGLGQIPVYFEPNQGQFDSSVRFVSRGANYRAWIGDSELMLEFAAKRPGGRMEASQSRIRFGRQKPSRLEGLERFPGISNYFRGQDPKKWVTDVPNFAKVKLHDVYPGIDIVFYAQGREIEYDFIVHPGADPKQIELEFLTDSPLRFTAPGLISQRQPFGELTQQAPRVYQGRHEVSYQARLDGRKLRFEYGEYDASQDLVVDPTLSYATYVGGNRTDLVWDQDAHSLASNVRVDSSGNLYFAGLSFVFPIAGNTFPTTPGAYRTTNYGGVSDAVVVKLNPAGTALLFSTYLGSTASDFARGIAVDSSNNVYVSGTTGSGAFPTTAGSFQPTRTVNFFQNLFVTKLAPAGNSLVYSTFVGASGNSDGSGAQAIAVTSAGEAVVGSQTCHPANCPASGLPVPLVNPAQSTTNVNQASNTTDATLFKLNAAGSALVFSTYQAPAAPVNSADWVTALALDASENIYITGQGRVDPTPGAYAGTATSNVWVAKYTPNGARVWAAQIGAVGNDRVWGIAVDSAGRPIITGQSAASATAPSPWPVTAGTIQTTGPALCSNHYVTKFAADGSGLVWSTFIAGKVNHCTEGLGVALDASDNVWTLGVQFRTSTGTAPSFPVTGDALQSDMNGVNNNDLTLAKINPTATSVLFGTFLGGTASEFPHGLALNSAGNEVFIGASAQASFPTTPGVYQTANAGDWDFLFAKLSFAPPQQTVQSSPSGLLFTSTGTGCDAGAGYTTPRTLNWTPGSSCQLNFSTPQAGPTGTQYVFQSWENASTNPVRNITAPASANTYTATFKTQHLLTTAAGAGGTVSAGGYFDAGTTATVTATPNAGFTFVNFTGDVSSATNPLNISMTAPRSVTANFAPGVYSVTIASVPAGRSFTVTGAGCAAGSYVAPRVLAWTFGGNCTVAFAPSQGTGTVYSFQTWEDASTSATRVIPAPAGPATYTATFGTTHTLTINVGVGGSVAGCASTCTSTHADSSAVNLTATPSSGYMFVGWGAACTGTGTCSLTMYSPTTVTATFSSTATTSLTALPGAKSGPFNLRNWPMVITNAGPGNAMGVSIDSFVLTQTAGTPCTPVVLTSFPQSAGNLIGAAASATVNTQLDLSTCGITARFKLTLGLTANSGATTAAPVFTNLLR